VGSVLGIPTAVIKKVADIMGAKYIHQAFVFALVFLIGFQLVAAAAERACRRGA
jgi:hypothetical protein